MGAASKKTTPWIALACLLSVYGVARADASYEETVQITGGQLVESLRSVPFMPKSFKQMLEPIVTRKVLHGNQLLSISKSSTEIIDLDQETVTRIDNEKKTYSVTTFAQMRQAMKDAPKKMEEAQAKMRQQQPAPAADAGQAPQVQVTFDVDVSDPGVSKTLNGVMAKQQIMTMKAHITDLNPPPDSHVQTVTYSMISEIWTAPEPAEMKEIDEFNMRYGKKLMQGVDMAAMMGAMKPAIDGAAIAPLFAKNPGMGPAVQEMSKRIAVEMEKIKGTRILEITRMGGEAMVAPGGGADAGAVSPSGSSANSAAASAAGAAVGQATTDTATAAAAQQTSKLGAFGSALGNSVLGAFHRNSPPPPPPPPSQPATPAGDSGAATQTSAVLYETTTQKTNFSREPAPPSAFQIPAGFTQVDSSFGGRSPK
jgi:hypothetical protein